MRLKTPASRWTGRVTGIVLRGDWTSVSGCSRVVVFESVYLSVDWVDRRAVTV